MCEALKELFADDLRESREQGIIEGRIEGRNAGRSGDSTVLLSVIVGLSVT